MIFKDTCRSKIAKLIPNFHPRLTTVAVVCFYSTSQQFSVLQLLLVMASSLLLEAICENKHSLVFPFLSLKTRTTQIISWHSLVAFSLMRRSAGCIAFFQCILPANGNFIRCLQWDDEPPGSINTWIYSHNGRAYWSPSLHWITQ